jgi:hypothetical protein
MAHIEKAMLACIETCDECRRCCLATLSHCLEMGGEHAISAHIQLLLDCAEACQASANFMSRGSDQHADACAFCAEVCEACAESCEALGGEEMKKCAEVCRRCAQSCRQMAGATA